MTPEILAMEKEADQLKNDGKHPEAIEKHLEILKVDENFVRSHLALAVLYHKTETHDKSVAHAEKDARSDLHSKSRERQHKHALGSHLNTTGVG